MIDLLDNCQYGDYKFLLFITRAITIGLDYWPHKKTPINLITWSAFVSQWGHDFRPAYLKFLHLKSTSQNFSGLNRKCNSQSKNGYHTTA
jgi:ATP-dependent DNA helicase RecQ